LQDTKASRKDEHTRFPACCTTQPNHSSQSRKRCFSIFCPHLEVKELALLGNPLTTRAGFWGAVTHSASKQPPAPGHRAQPGGEGNSSPWESHPAVSMATAAEQGVFHSNRAADAPRSLSEGGRHPNRGRCRGGHAKPRFS